MSQELLPSYQLIIDRCCIFLISNTSIIFLESISQKVIQQIFNRILMCKKLWRIELYKHLVAVLWEFSWEQVREEIKATSSKRQKIKQLQYLCQVLGMWLFADPLPKELGIKAKNKQNKTKKKTKARNDVLKMYLKYFKMLKNHDNIFHQCEHIH